MDRSPALLGTLLSDQVLWFLVLAILTLVGLAFFFAVFTFFLRLRNERESRLWDRLKQEWDSTFLEVLSKPEDLESLWEKVGPRDHLHFLEFVLRYAQRVGGPERQTLRKLAAPYLREVVPRLDHRRMGIRARAVQMLGTLGLPEFADEIKHAIQDPSPFVAALAGRLLAHELGAEVAPEICQSLPRFKTFRTWYLVDMVVAMGPEAIPSLRGTLDDPDMPSRTRSVAAHSLSVLRDLGSADLAARLLKPGEDSELLSALLRLLAQVGTTDHSEAARVHLDSADFFVRAAATRTLSALGGEDDLPLLIEGLGDSSPWVRMAAARGVYRIGGKPVLSSLSRGGDPSSALFRQVLAEEGGA